jgi:hypothetical protein
VTLIGDERTTSRRIVNAFPSLICDNKNGGGIEYPMPPPSL